MAKERIIMAEAKLDVKLPEKVDENIGRGLYILAESIGKLIKLPSRALEIAQTASSTLFKPLTAYLNGAAAVIEARSFVEAQNIRMEVSQCKLAMHVASNLAEREARGEAIPQQIMDTDNLFAIQNAASETTDEDFLRFWAGLYAEEACKPNTVSKKTVELCKVLDKSITEVLEKRIFPYCSSGFFFAANEVGVKDVSIAEDYGFIVQKNVALNPNTPEVNITLKFGKYSVICRAGFSVMPSNPNFSLSVSGEEVANIIPLNGGNVNLDTLIKCMTSSSVAWTLFQGYSNYRVQLSQTHSCDTMFVIVLNGMIVYPQNWVGRTVEEYKKLCLDSLIINKL